MKVMNERVKKILDFWFIESKPEDCFKNNDIYVYNLLTKSEYKFPNKLPNGKYRIP